MKVDFKVLGALGLMVCSCTLGMLVKNVDAISNSILQSIFKHPIVTRAIISCLVILITFLILYFVIKRFLKWQDPEAGTSGSQKKI